MGRSPGDTRPEVSGDARGWLGVGRAWEGCGRCLTRLPCVARIRLEGSGGCGRSSSLEGARHDLRQRSQRPRRTPYEQAPHQVRGRLTPHSSCGTHACGMAGHRSNTPSFIQSDGGCRGCAVPPKAAKEGHCPRGPFVMRDACLRHDGAPLDLPAFYSVSRRVQGPVPAARARGRRMNRSGFVGGSNS